MSVRVFTGCSVSDFPRIVSELLPQGDFRRILVKPNWVMHEQDPCFPIAALVTNTALIEAVVDACLQRYPNLEWITVGDVPLQTCEFELLMQQSGVTRLIEKYRSAGLVRVRFADLRRERFKTVNGFHVPDSGGGFGDPCGYKEVILDSQSFLEPISERSEKFRVSDYSPQETTSSHRTSFHRYLIAGSALECDLLINLPKMKVHQKAGVTGALKNLVGINGNKAYLVHYQHGRPEKGGDEFPVNGSKLVKWQTRVREVLQKRSRPLFSLLRVGWRVLKRLAGLQTVGTRENLGRKFYISGGSWFGNDTVWRMVYDLNKIARYASADGTRLEGDPQRAYIAIVDGLIAGEGNGPLQPLPVDAGVIIGGDDPFLIDIAMAQLMGFDYKLIPSLANHKMFQDAHWGAFNPEVVSLRVDERMVAGIEALKLVHHFMPSPGWKGHIERAETMVHA